MQSMCENDFECFASTVVDAPVAKSPKFLYAVRFNFLEADFWLASPNQGKADTCRTNTRGRRIVSIASGTDSLRAQLAGGRLSDKLLLCVLFVGGSA